MRRNQSVPLLPGYHSNHPLPVRGLERRSKPMRLCYFKSCMYDFPIPHHEPNIQREEAQSLVKTMSKGDWRFTDEMKSRDFIKFTEEELREIRRGEGVPSVPPSWIRHDKQVCRFFAYTQDSVTESNLENSRVRFVTIFYHLEDGTMQLLEKKVENSGLPQGAMVNRHCIMKEDGSMCGLDDLKCGTNLSIYGRTYRIVSCDAFTRWYYEQNGIDVGESEEDKLPVDAFEAKKRFLKAWDEKSAPREVVEGQIYNEKFIGGNRGTNNRLEQFMRNDLRVLRFYCYWDDLTVYGVRQYYVLSFFLSENMIQIADVHQRNSGRDPYPVFFKKGMLPKKPTLNITPGMLQPDAEFYMPQDLKVGETIEVYGRKLFLYDCDPFTRKFYRCWLDTEQESIKIPDPPSHTVDFPIPPHVGVGTEEDTLGSKCFCTTCGRGNGRGYVGKYTFADLWVGNIVNIASVGFRLLRPDEYSLNYMEQNCHEYPYSDVNKVRNKLKAHLESSEGKWPVPSGTMFTPEELQSFGCLNDQEIITLLRRYATQENVKIAADDVFA